MFLITEILIIYYHYTKNVRILVRCLPNARYAQTRTRRRTTKVGMKLTTGGETFSSLLPHAPPTSAAFWYMACSIDMFLADFYF